MVVMIVRGMRHLYLLCLVVRALRAARCRWVRLFEAVAHNLKGCAGAKDAWTSSWRIWLVTAFSQLYVHLKVVCFIRLPSTIIMNKYRAGGPSKASATTLCQKCLKRGISLHPISTSSIARAKSRGRPLQL